MSRCHRSLVPSLSLLRLTLLLIGCQPVVPSAQEEGKTPENLGGSLAVYPEPPQPEPGSDSADEDNPWLSLSGSTQQDASDEESTRVAPSMGSGGTGPEDSNETQSNSGSRDAATASGGAGTFSSETGDGGAPPLPPQMHFSAYWESETAAKLLVIDQVGGGPTQDCGVEIYSNGATDPWRTLALESGKPAGTRHVLCIPDAHHPACTMAFGGSAFNGNDALRLRCGEETLDVLGVLGVDPGAGWTSEGYDDRTVSTVDQGLWRCQVESLPEFDLAEWVSWDAPNDAKLQGSDCSPSVGWGGAGGAPLTGR